jgi:hypothetical protein
MSAKAGKVKQDPCAGRKITVQQASVFIERTWRLIRWKREKPKPSTVRAYRNKLRCAGRGNRGALKHRWRSAKRAFYQHRHQMRELIALTPYDCGSAGRFAIPCAVVACESGYSWGAVNPTSGARTAYQFLPSTYYGVCRSCDWSRLDLHFAAGVVWARSAGSEWACA